MRDVTMQGWLNASKAAKECLENQRAEKLQIEKEHLERIRKIKSRSKETNHFESQVKTQFQKLPVKLRTQVKIPERGKTNRIPRPVWGIIIEYCDASSRAKLEKVCRLLYQLCNQECRNCTSEEGSQICTSFWKQQALTHKVEFGHSEANCYFIKRVVLQNLAWKRFQVNLYCLRENSCSKGLHFWEDVKNKGILGCVYCRKGAGRNACAKLCSVHKNPCGKPSPCSAHRCFECSASTEVLRAHKLMQGIFDDCSEVRMNMNGSKQCHALVFKANLRIQFK